MTPYRVLVFGDEGIVRRVHELECESDDAARDRVIRFRHPDPVEIWRDGRLIWSSMDGTVPEPI